MTSAALQHFFPDDCREGSKQVFITKGLGNVVAYANDGVIRLPRDLILSVAPSVSVGGSLLYGLNVLRPVLSQPEVRTQVASSLILEVAIDGLCEPKPVAISTSLDSNRVAILASAVGTAYKGGRGNDFKVIDAALRQTRGGEGIFPETLGRWGLNIGAMPGTTELRLRCCPFSCEDGAYLIQLKFWSITTVG